MIGFRMEYITWYTTIFTILLTFSLGVAILPAQEQKASKSAATAAPEEALENPELASAMDAWLSGDVKSCYKLLGEAKAKNEELSPPEIIMALLYSNAQHYRETRTWLEKAVEVNPNDPEAYFQLAGIALQDRRLVEADLLLEKGAQGLDSMRKARESQKKDKGSRERYLEHEFFSLQSSLARFQGNLDEAIQNIKQITQLEPENDEPFLSLGFLLYEQKKNDKAQEAFEQARKINEKQFPGWLVMAMLLDRDSQSDEAKKLIEDNFKEEMQGQPLSVPVVRLYLKWNRMDEAEKMIEQLQKEFPKAADPWILGGEIALYRHQYRPAEEMFRRAVMSEQNSFEATNGLALALGDQGNRTKLKEAKEIAYQNWQRNPNSLDAKTTYAWMLYLSGERKEAEAFFAPMLESGKISPTIAYYLAEIANTKGEDSLALNFIDLALEQKGNFPKREAALELQKLIEEKLKKEQDEFNKTL